MGAQPVWLARSPPPSAKNPPATHGHLRGGTCGSRLGPGRRCLVSAAPATVGQDNGQVYGDVLGMSGDEVAALTARGVI